MRLNELEKLVKKTIVKEMISKYNITSVDQFEDDMDEMEDAINEMYDTVVSATEMREDYKNTFEAYKANRTDEIWYEIIEELERKEG